MFKPLFTALLLASAVFNASAADVWVSGMATSYHADRSANYNESNPGVGLEIDPEDSSLKYVLNVYKNSFGNVSVLVAAAWTPVKLGAFKAGVVGGAVSGYPLYHEKFGPVAALLVTYEGEKYGVNLITIPQLREKATSVATLQVKIKF